MKDKRTNILVIEDSKLESDLIQDLMKMELRKHGFTPQMRVASTEAEAYKSLSERDFDIVIFDIDLDRRGAGLDLLEIFSNKVHFPIISSCRQSDEVVKRAYELGCEHFLKKPTKESKVAHLIFNYKNKRGSKDLLYKIKSKYISQDEETLSELSKVISSESSHIFGPTGVGKQVVAELIHEIHKEDKPFIERNCSSVTDSLSESFLFGHKKGAFTGADSDRKGIFELASGGTVFLDEIDKTSISFQSKLLKVIEQKEVVPVGYDEPKPVSFSLVTASSRNIGQLVEEGLFLPDLWERLQNEIINLKPLQERTQDIDLQIKNFIRNHESGRLFIISEEAKNFLNQYHWPGNTRELKNTIDKLQRKNITILRLKDLSFLQTRSIKNKYNLVTRPILKSAEEKGLKEVLNQISKEVIHHFYSMNQEKKRATIRQLGISSDTLYKHLKDIGEVIK